MRNKSKIISIFTSICMMLVMLPSLVFAQNDISATDIVIMHTNDVHSRVQGSEYDTYLGYATVKSVKDKVEEVAPVLLLDAGDALHGLPIANLSNGQNIIKVMNEVRYDAMALGNHDFNYGANALVSMQGNMEFDLLSANVTKDGNHPFKTSKIYTKGDKK